MNDLVEIRMFYIICYFFHRYIGKPLFAKDERFGIELDKWSAKGHDGRVGKFRYFTVTFGHGTFVTLKGIIEKITSDEATTADTPFDIGDYVLVKDNRKGYIRYIGGTGLVRCKFYICVSNCVKSSF